MGRRGTVVRVALTNFGTYGKVEVFPGPNLNLILGPNGTGKSTIVSAIVLGLGGNPKIIGRASQIGDYVKQNCELAEIEVELDSGSEERNVVIQLKFDKSNHKIWKVNGKHASQKEAIDLMYQFRIQVNNLCQFLPQDRVQDFAKMNNRELLLNTQKSVGPEELSELHQKLITLRSSHRELESSYAKKEVALSDAEQRNSRLAGAVKKVQERQNALQSLKNIEGKLGWIMYDTKRKKLTEIKNDKDMAEKEIKKHHVKIKEIETRIMPAKKVVANIVQEIIDKNRLVTTSGNLVRNKVEKVEEQIFKITSSKDELHRKIQEQESRKQELNEAKNLVQKLTNDLESLIETNGPEQSITEEIKGIVPKIMDTDSQVEQLNSKKSVKEFSLATINRELTECLREKTVLENVGKQRLTLLKKLDHDAYRSVLWLRENRHLFRGNVYEPILLEINVTNPKHAKYLENIISFRDLCIFTCEEVDDMNLLIQHLRVKQQIRVSVVHSGIRHTAYRAYQPPLPIDKIKQFGFFAYANTLLTGPEAIMKYLCRNCRIHTIPVGDARVNKTYESVPMQIRSFFSDTKKFAVSISQYTSEKSIRVLEIVSHQLLTLSLNTDSISRINNRLATYTSKKEEEQRIVTAIENQIQSIVNTRNTLISRQKELYSRKEQLSMIRIRLNTNIQNLKALENNSFNLDEEQRKYEVNVQSLSSDMLDLLKDVLNAMKKHQSHVIEAQLASGERSLTQKRVTDLVQEQQSVHLNINNLQSTLNGIKRKYDDLRAEAKEDYVKAKSLTDGITPDSGEFAKFDDIFNQLPDSIEELEEKISDAQSKVDCMEHMNDGLLKEYEDRVKLIESLKTNKEQMHANINQMVSELHELKDKWYLPLETLIQSINTRFQQYFEKMGCVGNVSIVKADNELDFEQYGLSVKVSYRNGQPLQELDQYVQSGGERAVATAIYMLSLQELTQVPFRCVDEINQGMDALNERKVFELIVATTSEEDTPQYFLLTPKLLPNLKYSKSTKVHVIHNGPYEVVGDQYNVKKILDNIRQNR